MAIDPICGMTVDETSPLRAERDGQTFFFCSEHCRRKFIGQGQRDLLEIGSSSPIQHDHSQHDHSQHGHAHHDHSHHGHAAAAVKPAAGAKYFCPMCPGVESDKPGDCPKCGMALERNPAWQPEAKTTYTCPMHPEIRQDKPGNCPICGMALEPVSVAADAEEDHSEARDMFRRFWISSVLTVPVLLLAMGHL